MQLSTRTSFLFLILLTCYSFLAGAPIESTDIDAPSKITCVTNVTGTIRADTCGQGVGQLTLIHDGTAPFTYTWSHDSTLNDSIALNLVTGVYTVTVSDAAGCSIETQFVIGNVNNLSVTPIITADTCSSGTGGAAIDINQITGGIAPYSFQWDSAAGGGTSPIVPNLVSGVYTVEITDGNGCVANITAIVGNVVNDFNIITEVFPVACNSDSSGAAVVRVTGGGPTNDFIWLPLGDTTVLSMDTLLTGVPAGNYVVVVNPDRTVCRENRVVNIPEPDALVAEVDITPATECRSDDGLAVAIPTGGTLPYRFEWSNGDTDDSLENVLGDFYTLVVTDTNDCVDTAEFLLPTAPGPRFSVEILQEDNCGLGEGIARVRIDTGQAPFQVVWWTTPSQPSDTSQFAYNLERREAGIPYQVTVIDADTCLWQEDFFMPGRDPLSISVPDAQDPYCDLANGAITVNVSGGTLPYEYSWSTSPTQTSSTATGLSAGTYDVVVLDSFNCDIATEVTLVDELGFTVDMVTIDESCYGLEDGSAEAIVDGGRPPFTYEWDSDPQQVTRTATALAGGRTYNVLVRDAAGCERSAFGEVGTEVNIEAEFTYDQPIDSPIVLSRATVDFTNESLGAINYLWDFGDGNTTTATSPIHTYLDSGAYSVKLLAYNADFTCADSVTYGPFVVISDGKLFAPNVFTPNEDTFNDTWRIFGEGITAYDLRVYDRWGQLVFETQSPENGWDGTRRGGRAAPEGVYVYAVKVQFAGEVPFESQGTVLLVR